MITKLEHPGCDVGGSAASPLLRVREVYADNLLPGTYFSYQYDSMGNRTYNLDFSGTCRGAWYANGNNQITSRPRPMQVHVAGFAAPDAVVELTYSGNACPVFRSGCRYYAAVPVASSSSALAVTLTATVHNGSGSVVKTDHFTRAKGHWGRYPIKM